MYCGTYFSSCSIKGWPFIIEKDSFVFFFFFSTLPARFQEPNSAFLWKTAVILIDEIQRCPKQSGGSPTVAHRRGAPVLSLFRRKKGARPENTRGKKKKKVPIFSSKGPEKQHFFTGSGKVEENLFPLCRRKQYLLGFFSPLHAFSYKDTG